MTKEQRQSQLRKRLCLVLVACTVIGVGCYKPKNETTNNEIDVKTKTNDISLSSSDLCAGLPAVDFESIEVTETKTTETEVEEVDIEDTETEVVSSPPYSMDDLEYLAHLIYAEVGNLSEDAHWYCGCVVLNRVASDDYPDTIQDVINQKGQYSTHKSMWSKEPDDMSWEIAEELLLYGSDIPSNVIYQSMSKQGSGVWYSEKGEYFCYE